MKRRVTMSLGKWHDDLMRQASGTHGRFAGTQDHIQHTYFGKGKRAGTYAQHFNSVTGKTFEIVHEPKLHSYSVIEHDLVKKREKRSAAFAYSSETDRKKALTAAERHARIMSRLP